MKKTKLMKAIAAAMTAAVTLCSCGGQADSGTSSDTPAEADRTRETSQEASTAGEITLAPIEAPAEGVTNP